MTITGFPIMTGSYQEATSPKRRKDTKDAPNAIGNKTKDEYKTTQQKKWGTLSLKNS
jgi:hypothetical protein